MKNEDWLLKYKYAKEKEKLEIEAILVEKNLGLVNKVVHNRLKHTEDLFQEGTIGLLEAIRKYDSDRGVKFSTFAYNYIRLRATRAYINDRMIRFPVHLYYNSKIDVELKEDFTELGGCYDLDYTHIEAFNKCLEIMNGKSEQLEYVFIHRMILGKDLKDVAKSLDVCLEWVRQIEEKIRDMLRDELVDLGYEL